MESSRDYSDACRRLRELLPPQATTEERLGPALDFLNEVELRLPGDNYRSFCSVLENLAIRLITNGHELLLQPQDLPGIVREILDGQDDLIEKFNSYLPENLRVEEPAAATVLTAEATTAIKTWSPCQRLQPPAASGLDELIDQVTEVRNEEGGFLPAVAGAEPQQPAIPLFLTGGGGLARREEEETYNRKKKSKNSKEDGKSTDKLLLTFEKSRFLSSIKKRQRKLSSLTESYQQLLPSLYLYGLGKISSVDAESLQRFTKERRGLRPEVEKRPRPDDEAEQKEYRKRRRISPEKEKFEVAKEPEALLNVQKRCGQQMVRVEKHREDELKEYLMYTARYIDSRMNGTEEGDDDEDEIGGGKGRIHFLRCVEAMYGDKGWEMAEMVEAEPERLLPMVLRRLHEKIGELESASSQDQEEEQEVYPMARR